MNHRTLRIALILGMILSSIAPVYTARAENPFPSPDADGDGLSNALEAAGWYNLAGGPFVTDPNDADSDNDGLTDGEEKLFNTDPLDAHSPGLAVKYDSSFKTREYFSATDPAYLSMIQGGDRYLMTGGMVLRRGTTFNVAGPASGTLTISGTGMTALTPTPDPAHGGWTVTLPSVGTVGTYTMTVTDGAWTKSMPLYVIFELPTSLSQSEIEYYLYDDDPAKKNDEVSVFWSMQEWQNWFNCPQPDNGICSNWAYHVATGYAQAFWTEQFTKAVFVDHAIKAIQGKTSQAAAAPAIANWTDTEFRTRSGKLQNTWSSAMNRWNDGTGWTMTGGYCETTASVFTSILRSAGIAARPFTLDYNKTAGHGESGQIGTPYEYDHSVMMWLDGTWKAQRAYNMDETNYPYYPWTHGTTGVALLRDWRTYTGYYNDYYGDAVVSVGAGWDFQNGNNGGGVVNTVWPISPDQRLTVNQDYYWKSNWPLQITQSPYVDVLNCQLWKGDNWAPSEWSGTSNPAGRTVTQSYNLPAGIPDPANPLENWPYNPKPVACSASTPTDVCNAFKAKWTTTCPPIPGSTNLLAAKENFTVKAFLPVIFKNSVISNGSVQLGEILAADGLDRDGDGRFDELIVKFKVTSSQAGEVQLGGELRAGENTFRAATARVTLTPGEQIVQIVFDGQEIGDNAVDGPYQVQALWIAGPDEPLLTIVEPSKMLDYREYKYSTAAYNAGQFKVQAAAFTDSYTHQGIDENGNGLYEAILVNVPLKISIPGSYTVDGDLYDGLGSFVGHATWTGRDANAALRFTVTKTQPPYTLEHLNLIQANGPALDDRYPPAYTITDMAGKIEEGAVSFVSSRPSSEIGPLSVTPNTFTVTPVDTNGNGRYDILRVNVGVTVTNIGGNYRIEGLLEDDYGTEYAWAVSDPQSLVVGTQTMRLDFDGKMIYDQLPLAPGARSLKLVAVKIFSGNLSTGTLESEAKIAATTPAYTRSQFEPSSPAANLFQDDMESGIGKWTVQVPFSTTLTTNVWHSWSHALIASAFGTATGSLTAAAPLDLSNYAGPAIRFTNAYRMATANDKGTLEASTDGANWTTLATYPGSGSTLHWSTDQVDLSAYGKKANVQLRFRAQSQSSLLWYLDDIYIRAWPAVTSASFIYPTPVVAGADTTLTASYTSIDTTLPVTYTWNFCGIQQQATTPNIMYRFPNAGNCMVTLTAQNPYDSAAASPQTIYVNPSGNQFILNVDISPSGGGTVTKSPDRPAYNPGETVALTATPAAGYTFSNWSGACSGSGACAVTMDANKSVTATFAPNEYTLTVNTSGNGSVTKSPNAVTYHYGDVVQLTAVPDTDWAFSLWSGDLIGSANPATVTINGNKTVTATFVESGFVLTVNVVGGGSVARAPNQTHYAEGQQVTLTANPVVGWSFGSWSGDLTGSANPATLMMTAAKTVTATFTQNQYTLTANAVGQGSISKNPNQATYTYGQQVTLTPTPATGWSFSAWSGACTGSGACVVTIDGNKSVTATFTQNQYTLDVSVSGNGTVTKSPDQATYTHGMVVTLTPNPATGWRFSAWGGACSGSGACAVTMDGNKSVSATFTRIEYTLAVTVVGSGQVIRNNDGPYYYGDVVQLNAQISSGWSFANWSGDLSGTTNPISITIDGNKSVMATFTEDWYTLTVLVDGYGHVDVNPPGPYRYHAMPLLTAYPDPGWTFSNWTGDRVGTANPIEVTVNYNSTETAHFTPILYTFTTSVVGQGTISKSPQQTTYTYGQQVTVTATPAAGWSFGYWSGSCTGNGACVVAVDGNESVTATFLQGANTLDVTVVGHGTLARSPDQATYPNGTNVTLTATASSGWTFTGWTGDVSSTDNPLTIMMDGNKAITATFTQIVFNLTINAEHGLVSVDPAGPYGLGAVVTLTATANPGYTFSGWSGDLSGNTNPTTIMMNSDKTVTANFPAIPCYVPRLIAAIETANADPDVTTINLDAGCTYQLTAAYAADPDGYGPVGLPPITTPVTLVGSNSTIARNATSAFRLFYVSTSGSLTIENVTLSNGLAQGGNGSNAYYDGAGGGAGMGGAIFNRGILRLSNITLAGNAARGGNGGNDNTNGLYYGGGGGGGMGSNGSEPVSGGAGGKGGGLNGGAGGNCTVGPQNGGVGGGGGGQSQNCYSGTGGMGGFGGGGGGDTNGGAGGFGGGGGGGQAGYGGTAGAGGFGGGAGSVWTGGGGAGFGGAIFNDPGGSLTITDSTLSSNTAQGGNGTQGTDGASGSGAGGSGYGGAIFNKGGTLSMSGVTMTGNTVVAGTAYGGRNVNGRAVAADIYDWVQYTLTTTTIGSGSITRSSAGPYYNGDVVQLTAAPTTGWSFTTWGGDLSGSTSPGNITMDGNKSVTATFTQNEYSLTVNVAGNGTVSRSSYGPYRYGDVVALSAVADPGWNFSAWSGDLTGTASPANITIDGNKSVTATFTQNRYMVTVYSAHGTVSKAPDQETYIYGTSVVLTMGTVDPGWTFTGWSEPSCTGTGPCTVTVNANVTVTASFTPDAYTLTVVSAHGVVSKVPDDPTYTYGTSVVLTMGAVDPGWIFTGWSDPGCTGTDPCTVNMNGDKTVTANFTQNEYALTITQVAGGTINVSPAGPYHLNDSVTVTADPNDGWSFSTWTNDCVGQGNPCTLTMNGPKSVSATFTQDEYTLTVNSAHGTVTKEPENPTYTYGTRVVVTMGAVDPGWTFTGWSEPGCTGTGPCTVTMNGNTTVTANFTQNDYRLTVNSAHGAVTKDPDQTTYTHGQTVVLTMGVVDPGWTFTGWSEPECTGTGPCTVSMNGNTTVTANFTQNVVTLTISQATGGTITATPAGPYHYGDVVTVEAVADTGFGFTGWTGDLSGTSNPRTLTLNGDKTVGATFELNVVTLTLNQSTGGTITATPAGPYHHGDVVTVEAVVDTGYAFTGWTGDLSGTTNPRTITLDGDKTVGATFEPNVVTLTLNQSTGGMISAVPTSPYHYGDTVVLTATAEPGYTFSGWTEACLGTVGTTCHLTLNGDKTVGATFTQDAYTLTVVSAHGAVSKNPDQGTYTYGTSVVLMMGAVDAGWMFTGWSGDECTGIAPCTVTISGNTLVTANFQPNVVTLTLNQSTGGTITAIPAGLYHYGDVVTVEAVADTGYGFTGWTGDLSGTANPRTITLNGDKTVGSTFEPNVVTLTLNQATGGTITAAPAGPYHYGDTVVLTVNPDAGYTFTGWTGDCSGTALTCNLTLNGNKTVGATFTQNEYTLTANVVGHGAVTRSSYGPYHYGDVVALTAVADPGWDFSAWSGDLTGSVSPANITIDGNKSVTATFTQGQYTLDVAVVGSGTVAKTPDQGTYTYGTEVRLTPMPAAGWSFAHWSGACTGSGACVVTMDGNKSVTATFTQDEYTLTVNSAHGAVTKDPDQTTYTHEQTVVLTMGMVDPGWTFSGWSEPGCIGTGPCTVAMNGNTTITANFTQNVVTLTLSQPAGGTITATPAGPYHYGDVVTVEAVADTGYGFTGWTGDLSGTANPRTITLNGDKTVGATFEPNVVTLTLNQATGGTITATPAGPYHYGDAVMLTVDPDAGYTFTSWTGDCNGTALTCNLTLNGNKTVGATFEANVVSLTINQSTGGTISAAPVGPYHYGDSVVLTVNPDDGYTFTGWTGDCSGTALTCNLTLNSNKTVGATFTQNEYALTITQATGGTISANPTGPYHWNDSVTLTGDPNDGWSFSTWTGACVGQSNPCTLTMDGPKNVSAIFTQNRYTLTIDSTHGAVSKDPNQTTYTYGMAVVLTMGAADPGWTFTGWSEPGCTGTGPCTVTMYSNKTVTASFTQDQYTLDASATGQGTVYKDPDSPTYTYGQQVTVVALPYEGARFVSWTGDASGSTNPLTITMDGNKHVTAVFEVVGYGLVVFTDPSSGGVVTKSPDQQYYPNGTQVTLTATPVAGYTFAGWNGDLSGIDNPTYLLMQRDTVVTARFTPNTVLPKDLISNAGTLREDFETMTGWTVAGTSGGNATATLDTSNYKVGAASIKLTPPTSNGYVQISKNVNWNLSAPAEQGNFRFWVYVNGASEPTGGYVIVANDSAYNNYFITYYNATWKFPNRPGWNLINLRTSDWTVGGGSPSWANPITRLRFRLYGTSATTYSLDGLTSGVVAIPAVLFTFDDADRSFWSKAYDYMRTRNTRGTGYIITDLVDGATAVTWTQLQKIYADGWTIGNHTKAHIDLTTQPLADQQAALLAARTALNDHGMTNVDYVAYPYGNFNADTLTAMANLSMRSGRTISVSNFVSPLTRPYEIPQRGVQRSTTLATAKSWIDTVKSRQEIVVLTLHDISSSPTSVGWYTDRLQSLVDYCIQQGVAILTMDDLYRLQSGDITIPGAR